MRYNAQLLQRVELRGQALDVAFIIVLAHLEEVGISFLPLSSLDCTFPLLGSLEFGDDLTVSVVDQAMCFPEHSFDTFGSCIIEVGEESCLAGNAQSER